jgi:transcriptional regulator with XRE-family HTH domain
MKRLLKIKWVATAYGWLKNQWVLRKHQLVIWHLRSSLVLRFRWQAFWYGIALYEQWIKTVVILGAVIGVSWRISLSIDLGALESAAIGSYFITAAAMIGGILAIVFSLALFAQQSAADMYSSRFFEIYTHDLTSKFNYFFIVGITLAFFWIGVFLLGRGETPLGLWSWSVPISIVLIATVFVLIDWQHKNVRTKTNPVQAIRFLERMALRFLKDTDKQARAIGKVVRSMGVASSDATAVASAYHHGLSPRLADLDRQIENLFEISMKLSEKQEVKTTNEGLNSVCRILNQYFVLRSDTSLILPSTVSIFAQESDSQDFIGRNLERFNNAGEKFMDTQRTENAVFIVRVYESLAEHAKKMKFAGPLKNNPILEQVSGYFNTYVSSAIRKQDQEVIFQSIKALQRFANIAIDLKITTLLLGAQKPLQDIAIFGLAQKLTFLVDSVTKTQVSIVDHLIFGDSFNAEFTADGWFESLKAITVYYQIALKETYLPDDFTTRMGLSAPYEKLIELVGVRSQVMIDQFEDGKVPDDLDSLMHLFESTGKHLRELSEAIKDCDSTLIDTIGRLIEVINRAIVILLTFKNLPREARVELEKRLGWNIHLPSWFAHYAESFRASNAFSTLIDAVAKTGLLVYDRKLDDHFIGDCVNSLYSIANHALAKIQDGSGYDEPRIMKKICYFGILAKKDGNKPLLTEVGTKVYEFEQNHFDRYLADVKLPEGVDPEKVLGMVSKNQLENEMYRWREDFAREHYNGHRIMDSASDRMHDLISVEDIDWFIFEVWGSFPSHSLIEPGIKSLFEDKARRGMIRRIIDLINRHGI